ncbi:MAG TPA: hypothetical protein VMV29_06870 [Ktedonobacterales bacterium]|nr:hypothetical protein [Ktedonobacterales bacterium]
MEIPRSLLDGMGRAETLRASGDHAGALAVYQALWDDAIAANDMFQACIIAHFAAHAQPTPGDQRDWRLRALHAAEEAAATGDERVSTFFPSLYGNLADVSLRLGDRAMARDYLDRATQSLDVLADNDYWREVMAGLVARLTEALDGSN